MNHNIIDHNIMNHNIIDHNIMNHNIIDHNIMHHNIMNHFSDSSPPLQLSNISDNCICIPISISA